MCFGFGCGHFIRRLLEYDQSPFQHIFCIEPQNGSLELTEIDKEIQILTGLAERQKISLHISDNLNFVRPSNFLFYSLPYYSRNYPEEWRSLDNFLKEESKSISAATKATFSKSWLRNYFRNLDLSGKHPRCFWLQRSDFSGIKNVLFVGAAPELEAEITRIHEIRQQVFLIVADTCCAFLQKQGIVADLIFSVDSGRGTTFHFRDSLAENIPIVTWLGGNQKIWDLGNPVLLYSSSFPIDQVLQGCFPSLEMLENPSWNLTGLAANFAKWIGAKRFLLAGVSFMAENSKTHCRGTGYETFQLYKVNRRTSLEAFSPHTYQQQKISSKNRIAREFLMSRNSEWISKLPENDLKSHAEYTIPVKFSLNFQQTPTDLLLQSLALAGVKREVLNQLNVSEASWLRALHLFTSR